nr:MAG TPA: hypothetical protein [Bacteriophage sp.]
MQEEKVQDMQAIEAEKKELRLLIGQGISFVVDYHEDRVVRIPRYRYLQRLLTKKQVVREEKQLEFLVKEPTAFTLDRALP